jgi:hypothetical protein
VTEGDVVLKDVHTREVIGFTIKLRGRDDFLMRMARELRFNVKWDDTSVSTSQSRMSGIRTISRVFGFTGPKPLRRRYGASAAMLHRENPGLSHMLETVTTDLWQLFNKVDPGKGWEHKRLVEQKVNDDWLFGGCPWTSGVINRASLLPYHRDSGNIAGTWSAMLALRKGVDGGHLTLPEYNVTLEIPDKSVTIFDGQQVWHGVTPFEVKGNGYRFTLVWYAKNDVAQAGPMADEARRAAVAATERTKR